MKKRAFLFFFAVVLPASAAVSVQTPAKAADDPALKKIIDLGTTDNRVMLWNDYASNRFGGRESGPNAFNLTLQKNPGLDKTSAAAGAPGISWGSSSAVLARGYKPRASGEPKARPLTAALTSQTLESGFGMKLAALLARSYTKGRDWYDFLWYVNKKTVPHLELLRNALERQGPWAGEKLSVDPDWVADKLKKKIIEIDWGAVRRDVQRFLPLREQGTLKLWDRDFFLYHLGVFAQNLAPRRLPSPG